MHFSDGNSGNSFELPAEIVEIADIARRIVEKELMPLEREFLLHPSHAFGIKETTNLRRVFAADVVDRLIRISRETGLWYLMVPEQFGGSGFSLLAQIAVLEQLNYTAVPFPFANVGNILYQCKGDQIDRFLEPIIEGELTTCFAQTEADAGSDPGGMMQTQAVEDGGGWLINGTKMWISGAAESDLILVQAVTDKNKRQHGGITMFIVQRDNPGVLIEQPGIKTWLGPHPAQYVVHFNDCRLTNSDVLGDVGDGFKLGQHWLTLHDRLLRGPYALGKMRRALDMSIDWSKQRVTFGKPLSERQAIQWQLVDMFIDLRALQALTYQIAARAESNADMHAEACLVKLTSMVWGARTIDRAIQIHGAMGESLELPLTLFYRYLRHGQIGGGTNEIHRMQIAKQLLQN